MVNRSNGECRGREESGSVSDRRWGAGNRDIANWSIGGLLNGDDSVLDGCLGQHVGNGRLDGGRVVGGSESVDSSLQDSLRDGDWNHNGAGSRHRGDIGCLASLGGVDSKAGEFRDWDSRGNDIGDRNLSLNN